MSSGGPAPRTIAIGVGILFTVIGISVAVWFLLGPSSTPSRVAKAVAVTPQVKQSDKASLLADMQRPYSSQL